MSRWPQSRRSPNSLWRRARPLAKQSLLLRRPPHPSKRRKPQAKEKPKRPRHPLTRCPSLPSSPPKSRVPPSRIRKRPRRPSSTTNSHRRPRSSPNPSPRLKRSLPRLLSRLLKLLRPLPRARCLSRRLRRPANWPSLLRQCPLPPSPSHREPRHQARCAVFLSLGAQAATLTQVVMCRTRQAAEEAQGRKGRGPCLPGDEPSRRERAAALGPRPSR